MPPKSKKDPKPTQNRFKIVQKQQMKIPADHCYWEALKQGKPLIWTDDCIFLASSATSVTIGINSNAQTSTIITSNPTSQPNQQLNRIGTLPQQIAQAKNPKKLRYLLFFGHQPCPTGKITDSCLSQWWSASFTSNGITYPNCETWMMAEKARLFSTGSFQEFAEENSAILKQMLATKDPAKVKKLGRQVLGFDPIVWEQHRFDIIVKGNWLKFTQNQHLMNYLLETKNRFDVIVEASPFDATYGIGIERANPLAQDPKTWRGPNLLGFALTRVRDALVEVAEGTKNKNISNDGEDDSKRDHARTPDVTDGATKEDTVENGENTTLGGECNNDQPQKQDVAPSEANM